MARLLFCFNWSYTPIPPCVWNYFYFMIIKSKIKLKKEAKTILKIETIKCFLFYKEKKC